MRSSVKMGVALAAAAAVSLPAAQPLSLTPLDQPIAREPGKIEVPNVQAVQPVTPPAAPAAGGWPAKIQGPTMVDKSGEARRAPAKIDAITIKQGVAR